MSNRLPADVAEALHTMRQARDPRLREYLAWARRQNWDLDSLAEAMGVTRQAVSVQVRRYLKDHPVPDYQPKGLPKIPHRKPKPRVTPPKNDYVLDVLTIATLKGLWEMSSRVRGKTPQDSIYRKAGALLEDHLRDLVGSGLPAARIAHDMDLEDRQLRQRMERWGIPPASLRG